MLLNKQFLGEFNELGVEVFPLILIFFAQLEFLRELVILYLKLISFFRLPLNDSLLVVGRELVFILLFKT